MATVGKKHRQIKLNAQVQNVEGSGYSYDADVVAELEATIRLGGRFDREQVATLVTNIVNQLVAAFDEGETVPDAAPEPDAGEATDSSTPIDSWQPA